MDDMTQAIGDILLEMELELRRLRLWESVSPSSQDLLSPHPFCYDSLSFPQWLQWLFLARMRGLLESGGPYPQRSGIHAYAEEWAAHASVESRQLLLIIKRFDELITAASSVPSK